MAVATPAPTPAAESGGLDKSLQALRQALSHPTPCAFFSAVGVAWGAIVQDAPAAVLVLITVIAGISIIDFGLGTWRAISDRQWSFRRSTAWIGKSLAYWAGMNIFFLVGMCVDFLVRDGVLTVAWWATVAAGVGLLSKEALSVLEHANRLSGDAFVPETGKLRELFDMLRKAREMDSPLPVRPPGEAETPRSPQPKPGKGD